MEKMHHAHKRHFTKRRAHGGILEAKWQPVRERGSQARAAVIRHSRGESAARGPPLRVRAAHTDSSAQAGSSSTALRLCLHGPPCLTGHTFLFGASL